MTCIFAWRAYCVGGVPFLMCVVRSFVRPFVRPSVRSSFGLVLERKNAEKGFSSKIDPFFGPKCPYLDHEILRSGWIEFWGTVLPEIYTICTSGDRALLVLSSLKINEIFSWRPIFFRWDENFRKKCIWNEKRTAEITHTFDWPLKLSMLLIDCWNHPRFRLPG